MSIQVVEKISRLDNSTTKLREESEDRFQIEVGSDPYLDLANEIKEDIIEISQIHEELHQLMDELMGLEPQTFDTEDQDSIISSLRNILKNSIIIFALTKKSSLYPAIRTIVDDMGTEIECTKELAQDLKRVLAPNKELSNLLKKAS